MKNLLLVLNVILLLAVGVLFYLHFSSNKNTSGKNGGVKPTSVPMDKGAGFRMAYFEMEAVNDSFQMMKDVRAELNKKEEQKSKEYAKLRQEMEKQWNDYNNAQLTAQQSELIKRELQQKDRYLTARMQEHDQNIQDFTVRKQTEVRTMIENFLAEYNKSRNFSYIIGYEPGFIFYYKDSAFNITTDLLQGLNESYKKKK